MSKSEILFYYEVKNCNPNGDPLEGDAPRRDGDYILVSDVRLKRTIRDYWDLKAKDKYKTYFLPKRKEDGDLSTRTDLFKAIPGEKSKDKINTIFNEYIDMRLFGAVFALDKKELKKKENDKERGNYNFTGAVQFSIGKSKHKVSDKQMKGTTVAPSRELRSQGTFTNRFIIPYALIEFYGIINYNNYPIKDESKFEDDITYLCEGMWEGTRNLFTRSKLGHRPALIIKVDYEEDKFIGFIGDYVKLETSTRDGVKLSEVDIRHCEDYTLNIRELISKLTLNSEIIKSVEIYFSEYFSTQANELKSELMKIDSKNKKCSAMQANELKSGLMGKIIKLSWNKNDSKT